MPEAVIADAVEKVIGWLRRRRAARPFEAFQIEVTSRCNIKCVMCPVTVLAYRWPRRDMRWETFERTAGATAATNLDYVITPGLDALKAYSTARPVPAFRKAIEDARAVAARVGLAFRSYRLEAREMAVCDLNPLKILFVAADGRVSPCVYTALAGQSEIPRFFDGRSANVPAVDFGNAAERPLMEIWDRPDYRAFRRHFVKRIVGMKAMALSAVGGEGAGEEETPAPEPCRSCPKLHGL